MNKVLEALAIAIIEEMCFYQKCKITAEWSKINTLQIIQLQLENTR